MQHERLTYTVDETAELLGVSRSRVYDCIRRGQIRSLNLGRNVVVPAASLEILVGASPSERDGGALNHVKITGRLARDPEPRQARTGLPMAILRLAVPRRNDDSAVFIDVVAFGTLADHAGTFVKGQPVRVGGRLDQREWTTDDGARRSAHQVVAWSIDALELTTRPADPVTS